MARRSRKRTTQKRRSTHPAPARRPKHEETRPDDELVVTIKEPRARVWTRRLLFGVSAFGLFVLVSFVVLGVLMVRAQREPLTLPTPGGELAVGRHVMEFVDESRRDVWPVGSNEARTVLATVWYPSAAEAPAGNASDTAPYLPPYWREAFRKEMGMVGRVFSRDPTTIRTQSHDDAPLRGENAPVVGLVPAPGASAFDYTTIAEGLASKGYVAVVLTPARYVDAVKRDGTLLQGDARHTLPSSENATQEEVATAAATVTEVWKADLERTFEQLFAPGGLLAGKNEAAVTVIGQGFGASVAFQVCKTQANCVATIDLDGPLLSNDRNLPTRAPTIALYSPGTPAENVRKYNDMVLQQQESTGYSLVSSHLELASMTDLSIRSTRGLFDPPTRGKLVDQLVEARDVVVEVVEAAQTPENREKLASNPPLGFRVETWSAPQAERS